MHFSTLPLVPLLSLLTPSLANPIPASNPADALNHHLVARGAMSHVGVKIVSNKSGRCLSVAYQSRYPNNGDPIVLVDCKQTKLWDIYQDGSVVMHDFNNMPDVASGYAIDAGTNPANGGRLKVWTSYPGLKAQTWHTSNNDRRNFTLAVGGNQCMDEGSNGIMQTWQCYQNNPNQVFHTEVPM